ncbi:MAG TPA: TolC family protein [Chitinophagaceae bacterium]|nr:TolC family protein [Chitinophagaceae bacterium]HAN37369.1 TolC family protein [Chitinophagaceae bacterium]
MRRNVVQMGWLTGWLLWGLLAKAQTTPLALQTAVDKASNNSMFAKMANTNEQLATAQYRQTDAAYLPQVQLAYSWMHTNNPLNVFGFKLQQQAVTAADFNPALLNNPNGYSNTLTQLTIQQPLVNLDAWQQRKAAQSNIAVYQLQTQRTQEFIRFEVTKAYLQLQLLYATQLVLNEALQTATAVQIFTQHRVQQGLLQASDALNIEVHLSGIRTQQTQVLANITNVSNYLNYLMGEPYGKIYTAAPITNTTLWDNNDTTATVRTDVVAMQKALEAHRNMMLATQKSYLPRLNAFGNFQLNDKQLFGFNSNAYLVGVQLSWDVFKGLSTQRKIATQKVEHSLLEKQLANTQQQATLEQQKTKEDLKAAAQKIIAQQQAVAQAKEALRITRNRYEQGLVNTIDVLMAQTQLSQQQLQLTQTLCEQQTLLATLSYQTSTKK